MLRRRLPLLLTVPGAALVAVAAFLAPVAPAAPSTSLQWPVHLGPCAGDGCPDPYPPVTVGTPQAVDRNVNTFVGQDFTADGSAEAEGITIVGGNLAISAGTDFSMGVAGVGSQVAPPPYTPSLPDDEQAVQVGGSITLAAGASLHVGLGEMYPLAVAYNGSAPQAEIDAAMFIDHSDALTEFGTTADELTTLSAALGDYGQFCDAALGTITTGPGDTITFQGDGTSGFQFFEVPGDLQGSHGDEATIRLSGVPATATVIVNFAQSSPTMAISGVDSVYVPQDLATRLIWNFPDAQAPAITGNVQLPGAILVGGTASTTTLDVSGLNGRVYVAGTLAQQSRVSKGGEIHSYAFTGELPGTCGSPTSPTGSPTSPTGPPTSSTSPATPTAPPSSTSTAPAAVPVPRTASRMPIPVGAFGPLADTGVPEYIQWLVPVSVVLVVAGATTVAFVRRRRSS